jgi:hypothetical protein
MGSRRARNVLSPNATARDLADGAKMDRRDSEDPGSKAMQSNPLIYQFVSE